MTSPTKDHTSSAYFDQLRVTSRARQEDSVLGFKSMISSAEIPPTPEPESVDPTTPEFFEAMRAPGRTRRLDTQARNKSFAALIEQGATR